MYTTWELSHKVIQDKSKTWNEEKLQEFLDYFDEVDAEQTGEDTFALTMSYMGMVYDCEISFMFEGEKVTIIVSAKGIPFITINLREKTSIIRTRNVDIPLLPNMNKLETVMKLKEKIYCFFNIEETIMGDSAHVMCDAYHEYSLLLYRILATDKPLSELSLYKKFGFKYKNQDVKNEEMILLLEEVRQTPMKQLAYIFKGKPYYKKMLSNESIQSFFTQMCPLNSNCLDCSEILEMIQDRIMYADSDIIIKIDTLNDYCKSLIQDYSC